MARMLACSVVFGIGKVSAAELASAGSSGFPGDPATARAGLRRAQSAAARELLARLAARHGNGEVALERGASGRPKLRLGDGSLLNASIAHSGHHVAAALALHGRVGIDLERFETGRDWRAIARAAFGPAEAAAVLAQGPETFYRIWCLREALAKATGAGLALVMDRRDRFPQGAAVDGVTVGLPEGDWRFRVRRLPGCMFALAWDSPGEAHAAEILESGCFLGES
ncbi:MAG: 4'-phosphopantetheinyl transferase superfamily protein [Alphaproteobacteria bacterium]|nr:4'-phosphopantetheinyl transferase superfamily protein [Alphaproteobacteria bacterium]